MEVLSKTGVFVEDQKAREALYSAGATVDEKKSIVKIPSSMIEDAIRSAPEDVLLYGRNPDFDISLETNRNYYVNFGSNIQVVDPYTGRVRSSTKKDLEVGTRLCDRLNQVSVYSRAAYPLDQRPKLMHLHTAEACLLNTTKHSLHTADSQWEAEQIIDMVAVVVGGKENLRKRKPISFSVSIASPLKLDQRFCDVSRITAKAGFATIIASMVMAGGTGPVHLAGVLVQTNAEVLAGIVLTQVWCKGAPTIYSSFSTGMDLRLGTSPLGSPETATLSAAVAHLCRYYQLPCLVPGIATDSKQPGSQAAFEKMLTGIPAAMTGANLIMGIGGLETGLTFDYGQAVLDDEIVRLIRPIKRGIEVDDETLSVDLIHEIGPFGEYLSHDSTLSNMKSISNTHLFDRSIREEWERNDRPRSYDKALKTAIDILENHEPEPLPEATIKAMRAIVEAAENEVGGT